MLVRQGHTYIGGASKPFFVSHAQIVSELSKMGFMGVRVYKRSEYPIFNLPPNAQTGSAGWDTIAVGTRAAPDGQLELPSEVKWVSDITPSLVPVSETPPGQTPPPVIQAGPSWGSPQKPKLPGVSGPLNVPKGMGMPMAIVFGVIGGAFFAKKAVDHMFIEGLEEKERKQILLWTASIVGGLGVWALVDLKRYWWISVDSAQQHFSQMK